MRLTTFGFARVRRLIFLLPLLLGLCTSVLAQAVPLIDYKILATRSHVATTFTQGLEIHDGDFYESSGLYGQSYLVRYPIRETAAVPQLQLISAPTPVFSDHYALPARYFAEGITLVEDKLYLLTWREKTLQIFSRKPLALLRTINYSGEGWGLAYTGSTLVRSDGSAQLFYHDTETFKELKSQTITLAGQPLDHLNELEYHAGFIFANRWYDNRIYKIDLARGTVVGIIDLDRLAAPQLKRDSENVLNGIAWDESRQGFWITGKRWSEMTLIQLESDSVAADPIPSDGRTP